MPTATSSAHAWYIMVTVFTLMGIGFLVQGKVKKNWLEYLFNHNMNIFRDWVELGLLTVESLRAYEQFGVTIANLQEPIPENQM